MRKSKWKQEMMQETLSRITPLHVLEREMDRLENELKQVEKHYAKESRKYRKQGEALGAIGMWVIGLERRQDEVTALLEHHRRNRPERGVLEEERSTANRRCVAAQP